jgi:alginate O-acetyltransferase complex protein AlgI
MPINFDSPYKATSISDFWRRWHISLSTFLRDYLYIALGGSRHGAVRRYANLLTTMVIGGLWHGASWTFVVWGTLHGLYLLANHAFRALVGERLGAHLRRSRLFAVSGWTMTMLAVVVGWVFFRSVSFDGAARMLTAMAGGGAPGSVDVLLWNAGLSPATGTLWCAVLGAVAVFAPNTNQIGDHLLARARAQAGVWRPALATSAALAALMLVVVNTTRDASSAFIYFNF